jgi:pimeloyl-ACP methyl ester carboxylesterase
MEPTELSPTDQGYVRANGLNIYYEEYGSGEPLVLLHGGTMTSKMWEPAYPGLRRAVPGHRARNPQAWEHRQPDRRVQLPVAGR